MRTALCVFPVYSEMTLALNRMKDYIEEAAKKNCDMIIFPEGCITGIDFSGNIEEDLAWGLSIDSEEIRSLQLKAAENKIHLVFGWLELVDNTLYDSALIIDDMGKIILHYRRIDDGWHYRESDPEKYRTGTEVKFAETRFGKMSLMICGDICAQEVIGPITAAKCDYVIHLMAFAANRKKAVLKDWGSEEFKGHMIDWKNLKSTICITNIMNLDAESLDEFYFGGAWIIDPAGRIIASKPVLEEGLLIHDFAE